VLGQKRHEQEDGGRRHSHDDEQHRESVFPSRSLVHSDLVFDT
jgi:hypothetical protein